MGPPGATFLTSPTCLDIHQLETKMTEKQQPRLWNQTQFQILMCLPLPPMSTAYGSIDTWAIRLPGLQNGRLQRSTGPSSPPTRVRLDSNPAEKEGNFSTTTRECSSIQKSCIHFCPGTSSSFLAGIVLSVPHPSGKPLTTTACWQPSHSVDIAFTWNHLRP